MKRRSHQKPIKAKVHIIVRRFYVRGSGSDRKIVKVFKGTRKIAAKNWLEERQFYFYDTTCEMETWEVE